jgi:preprotein translocase subunit SecB
MRFSASVPSKSRNYYELKESSMSNSNRYPFYVYDQYVKDSSFENPNYWMKYSESESKPEIKVNVETNTTKINDDNYEVLMVVSVKSDIVKDPIFVLELVYAGLVSVAPDLTPEVLEPILLVHCPFLMFPFVREIVANMTRYGGYPPLMIEPIDFAGLYLDRKKLGGQDGSAIEATA